MTANLNEMLLFTQNPRCSSMQHHISIVKVYEKDLIVGIYEIITPLKELSCACHLYTSREQRTEVFQSETPGQ